MPKLTSDDGVITVEAATAEEALDEISATLGPDAQIIEAGKVRRGGFGGFFARELVRLTARSPEGTTAPDAGDDAADSFSEHLEHYLAMAGMPGIDPGIDSGIDPGIDAGMDRAETAFGTPSDPGTGTADDSPTMAPVVSNRPTVTAVMDPPAPEAEPAPEPADPVGEAGPQSPIAEPTTAPTAEVSSADLWQRPPATSGARGTGSPAWSPDALVEAGLPFSMIQATAGLDGDDDMAWIQALARTVVPLCRPLPEGDALVFGPHADELAAALGMRPMQHPGAPLRTGTACLGIPAKRATATWLEGVLKKRWVHLVAGGEEWERLVAHDPLAVSWSRPDALVPAIKLCTARGLVLGYGKIGTSGRVVRANPIDLAFAIRDLVNRR